MYNVADRSGEVSVNVQSRAKQLRRYENFKLLPRNIRETDGVGRRKLLTMDEVLRLPTEKELIMIRGKRALKGG